MFHPLSRTLIVATIASISLAIDSMAELVPVLESADGGAVAMIHDGDRVIFRSLGDKGSLTLWQPDFETQVRYDSVRREDDAVHLEGGEGRGLLISEVYRPLNPDLIERTVTVHAVADERYRLDFGWRAEVAGDFWSFQSKEVENRSYSPGCSGPEFDADGSHQTFPFLGVLDESGRLYGLIGDTPGKWENRSFMEFDVVNRRLSLTNGDGSPKRVLEFPHHLDATTVYRARFDGWQHIERGEKHTWTTWIFASPAKSQYDVQLAAHLALANAKGFNGSALEAILRNTSYLLLRRNLLRPESDRIFISGVGYGWKQWVTDGFWMSRGLDDPEYDADAHAAVFYDRIAYEDNAQYYLIWSALVKRAGGRLDMRTVSRAYHFMRNNEVDGLFYPPRLKPEADWFRTYHDMLPYDDDDAPSSNQGFHCGALLAARELGFEVSEADFERAKAGFARMFNEKGGYMATSLKQQHHIGQDSLYGEVLTYAVFGEKILPDEMVRRHIETTMKIQSPHGMRVISKADGSLLDGHTGVYVYGGSWFLNDSCVYLDGLIHGMDQEWIDAQLLDRLEKELAVMPAFHESISTVDGHPHGHHLYSWNSGFWWLRRETLKRLGHVGPDPLEAALDAKLGVVRQDGRLTLDPDSATLRP